MKFSHPLIEGILIKRYKRFFVDFEIDGQLHTAHCANTGSMKTCYAPGKKVWVTSNDDPSRKLKYTLEFTQNENDIMVGVNTSTPNKIVKEALESQLLSHWQGYNFVKPEFKVSPESRIDFMIENTQSGKKHFVEVKNTTLVENGTAFFPDAVTERGQKHLKELMRLMSEGNTCEIIFTIQRSDADIFAPATHIDPMYSQLFYEALNKGLKVTPIVVHFNKNEINLSQKVLKIKE